VGTGWAGGRQKKKPGIGTGTGSKISGEEKTGCRREGTLLKRVVGGSGAKKKSSTVRGAKKTTKQEEEKKGERELLENLKRDTDFGRLQRKQNALSCGLKNDKTVALLQIEKGWGCKRGGRVAM